MTFEHVMEELRSRGKEQTAKIYRRHGMHGEVLGVSFADLGKLQKQIKVDHPLAQKLWKSGVADANALAFMVADPAKTSSDELEWLVSELGNYSGCDGLSGFVVRTKFAESKMKKWMKSQDEWIGRTGWTLVSHLAQKDMSIPDSFFEHALVTIEKTIHSSKNFTRHAMAFALIGIAVRNPDLEKKATAAAGRIGKVVVDHGETNCKTPDAIEYIKKIKAHRAKKAGRSAAKV